MDMLKPTWRFRPPPENAGILEMCKGPRNCLFGNACTKAHSTEELNEWWIRISYQLREKKRSMIGRKLQSPIESIRNLINENRRLGLPPKNVLTEFSGGRSILCKQNLFVTHLDKNKEMFWEFTVKTNYENCNGPIQGLQNVFFLEKDCREFSFSSLTNGISGEPLSIHGNGISLANYSSTPVMFAKICVKFCSPSYGHFNVTIVFDFGFVPRIVRYVGVVVAPEKHLFEKLSSPPTTTSDDKHNELTWTQKYKLVSFDGSTKEEDVNTGEYSLPANLQYGVEFGAFEYMDVNLTPENYRDRLHNLLFVEEYERRKRMSRLNVHCHDIFTLFGKRPKLPSMRTVDAQKALFIPVSEETLEEVGILITRGSKALIRLRQFVYGVDSEDYVVHEALVINILSGEVFLEISSKTLTLLKTMTSPVPVDICFRFVNTFLCMHSAIDRVNLDLFFYQPLLRLVVEISRNLPPQRHSLLSPTQATALSRIIHSSPGPPLLLLGPFGTGKTQTVAEAVKILISQQTQRCRILICTHSNSAADHYIEDYLHPIFKDKDEKNSLCEKPLRLYWEHRLATSISDTMLPYCIMDLNTGTFGNPTLEELARKTIVVTTLVTADMLIKCGVKPGFFTHIFIDEAAQAMEVETLIPLSLATEETKVVLAGDHLQLSPPVFSSIGRKLLLDKSVLVRLYETYPANSPRKILLLENFRSYPEIVNIPSKLFYEGSLISKKQLPGDLQYPVKFYGVHGLEERARDSPSYVNMPEVAEITERVEEMVNTWPKQHFGELKLEKTCVLSAHYAQIRQIRRELRVHGFSAVRVENVNNVQGLEFDVLFLSTVRTSRMLGPGQHEGKDLGFLSNPKLLNTAITRAKFCLVVIGDPKALCSVGDCRVCWKTILSVCSENGTFHYRVPLTQVLSSIREEQTQTVPPGFNNSLQKPYQRLYIAPPIPNEFPLFPIQMGAIGQAPPVTPMTLPLHRPSHISPIIPAALSTPLHYQSQFRVPVASYSHVGNHITGSMGNIYTPSEVKFQPTSPQKATLPTPPGVHASAASYSHIVGNHVTNSMGNIYSESEVKFQPTSPQRAALPTPHYLPAASYSYIAGNHITDSTRNVQASTEINLQSTSSESASLPTPPDHQSQTPATAASYYHIVGKHVTDTMRNLKPPSEENWRSTLTEGTALPTPLSTESTLPSSGDSKQQHSNHNRPFNPFGYNELSSSTNGLVEKPESLLHPDSDGKTPRNECSYPGNIFEESRELSLPATRSISPTASEESPILSLCQTLRHNIASSLRNITEGEEAVNMFIENPLEDISVEIKENLVAQVSLLQRQKSSLEQQQVLNRTLAKSIRSLQERSKQVYITSVKDRVLIDDYLLRPSPRLTHVHKINLDSDNEVQEWYRLRRQDPIVQDYIKSFEMLSERARTRGNQDNQMTESCDISDGGNTNLARSLRGWVLQPQSVVYPSGNSLYEEYLSTEEVAKKLENGELVPCTLSVDRSSSGKSATCVVDDPLEKNILIPDRQNMNRAFNTDYVAVEITQDLENQDLREGKVVVILQERHHRQVVCRLASSESTVMIPLNNTNPKFSILQSDNHVGQTGVAVFDTHGDQIHFQHFVSDVQDKLFLVQFLKWDVSYRYPLGFVAKCFDQYSDLNSLIPILCSDYGIPNNFPVAVTEETEARFPKSWRVPDVELKSRCRYEDAFTIDSEGAEELDDAISVRPVKYGIYSVTIHVADVSYFVSKGSLVDKTAQVRATSLYVAPPSNLSLTLLPKRLSHICSLLPGKERLAVSVEFVIDSSGNILRSPIFRRSIVVSQRQLSFEEVDGFLSGLEMAASRTSSSPLLCSLQVLYCLSRELWARRVRAGSFQACAEALQSASRRIVEELMIITNMAVAEKLSKFPDSHAVPFRIQQLPKYSALQSLASWAADNDLNLNEMWLAQFLTGYQEQESSHSSAVCLDLRIWQDICQEVKIGNMADLTEEILSLHKNSPITTRLQRQLPKSKYISSNQYSSTERRHFALNADCYTHFTSPIRRYFDIVVHRVLFSETTAPLYDDHEMEELCNMLNLRCGNAAAFSKHCSVVCEAESLRETDGWRTMEIDSVEVDCMTLKNVEDRKISSLQKVKLKVSDMGATMCHDEMKQFVACWTFHNVNLSEEHSVEHNLLGNHFQASPTVLKHPSSAAVVPQDLRGHTPLQPALANKMFQQRRSHTTQDLETKTVLEIPAKLWCELLRAIKKEDIIPMVKSMETINKHAVVTVNNKPSSERNDEFSISINTSGCNVVKRTFECGDKLQVLFTCSSTTSLPQPLLQAVQVVHAKICCIQHHRQPVECFCEKAKIPTRERYSSVEEYQRINIPLLMMESAERSVRAGLSSVHIKDVVMKWTKDTSNVIHGHFYIPIGRLSPSISIHKNDFVCVSTAQVISHGCIEDVVVLTGNDHRVQLVLNSACTTDLPETVNIEVIPQCLNYRRMITAVRNLPQATDDVRSLFLTRDLYSPVKQSRTKRSFTSSFTLDPSQRKALEKAIHFSFTIIEGQPGTGKTYSAAAIAEQFYLENSYQKPFSNVLLCSPTDQAVNDAENILSRVSTVRVLRAYDREIEAESFPEMAAVYGVHPRSSATDSILQESALHFKIRSNSNPFHRKILKYAQQLQNMLQESKGGDKQQLCRVIEEYKKLVDMAEEYELTESGVNIVLCTCIEAGSLRIQKHARIKQCIMDESHHCLEAESLMVFQTLSTRCERVVLLGDSRIEAVPIIENKLARSFGLNRSLFHSLRSARGKTRLPKLILDIQHRMLGL